MSKTYTYKELLDTFIATPALDSVHPDFRAYNEALVAKLEALFNVKLTPDKKSDIYQKYYTLWNVFELTTMKLQYWMGISGTWLEGGPLPDLFEMRKNDAQAEICFQAFIEARESEGALYKKYRRLLYELFTLFYGKIELTFTSEDLLRIGLDDTKKPDLSDYNDYI